MVSNLRQPLNGVLRLGELIWHTLVGFLGTLRGRLDLLALSTQSTASKKSKRQPSSVSTSTAGDPAASKGKKGVARVTRRSVANGNGSQPTLASMFAKV